MSIWIIITSSLTDSPIEGKDFLTRKNEYTIGITKTINEFKNYNIVIVENNSLPLIKLRSISHKTFLNNFNIPVLYTRTNAINTKNYGMKELLDIFECIKKFNIQDDDFIVKITGRYILDENSQFVSEVKRLSETNYDAIIRYGPYYISDFPEINKKDCVSGLIGLRCKYVKQIEIPHEDTFIEWNWAKKITELDDNKVCILKRLGIFIRPEKYVKHFLV